jgi:chemotaxis protein CheD
MYEKIFIHVGQICVASKPTEISTVLGSCVAVCLFDRIQMISAMNHYLLPLWNGNGLQSPKFGNISIPKMIENMFEKGCTASNIEAKLFGGANINITSNEDMMVGKRNVMTAKDILTDYRIKVTAEDTGGNVGRRIMMRSDIGKIYMKYSGSSQTGDANGN